MSSHNDSLSYIVGFIGAFLILLVIIIYVIYTASLLIAAAGAIAGALVSLKNFVLACFKVYRARISTL